ncbi:hypothetical protein [Serratia sp. Se-RSBMAAmG]|uniref:hypothetical protein n=1 Tax=Serratia sp. Se-RSBMAAmG TaxID=3043305 RepID=UPI0024AEFB1F|nr:hypothetical protein [Serratia sp. Se-RSBMAAmG]MDI6977236.1 hypothetical protein [Serratia sp. Se-RSBMAAmG]
MEEENKSFFKEAIKKGIEACKRLENNEAFVMYHLEQAKEAFCEFFEHEFSISRKRDNNLSIKLIVKLRNTNEKHVIIRVLFNEDSIDSFHSDFKQSQYNSDREGLVDYINCVLKDNNKMYWILG